MSLRFWALAAIYHTALAAVCIPRARAWLRRDSASVGHIGFGRTIAVDALWFGVTALVMAWTLAGSLPDPPFARIRFWSQAVFGEALLYLAFLSGLHWHRRLVSRSAFLTVPVLVLVAVYADAYHVDPHQLQVEEHGLDLAGRLRERRSGSIRLLHISDIQTHHVGDYERRVVRAAAGLAPDLVVMTGDYVHRRLLPGAVETGRELADLLRREGPRPPLGTWAVGGDTDGSAIEAQLRESGVGWLDDEAVTVTVPGGPAITLIGLAPATSRGRDGTLRRLIASTPPDSPRIVFGHAPDFILGLQEGPRIDLALAGHTHGGQVVLPFFGPLLTLSDVPRDVAAGGVHQLGPVRVHVSRGVGMERGSAPQIRFLCPPEICVLTLRY
jgi:hypothetical protein